MRKMKITTKRAVNILGKEEASGSNPDIGSPDYQRITLKFSKVQFN